MTPISISIESHCRFFLSYENERKIDLKMHDIHYYSSLNYTSNGSTLMNNHQKPFISKVIFFNFCTGTKALSVTALIVQLFSDEVLLENCFCYPSVELRNNDEHIFKTFTIGIC